MKSFRLSVLIALAIGIVMLFAWTIRTIVTTGQQNHLLGLSGMVIGLAYTGFGLGLKYADNSSETRLMVGSLFALTVIVTIGQSIAYGSIISASPFLTYLIVLIYDSYKAYSLLLGRSSVSK